MVIIDGVDAGANDWTAGSNDEVADEPHPQSARMLITRTV
jgi:hypothetical protein